jgi:putative holliday junction resolvase
MNFLGIDYGEKILGLAYSEGKFAQSYGEINIKEEDRLQKICRDLNISHVIVGLPEGRLKNTVIKFSQKLKSLLNIEIILWDETLTSHDAEKILLTSNESRKRRHQKEHSVAAALILQSYLDEKI